ncbi:ammonium transporter, partial [Klebsiella pneumoniae]
FANRVNFPAYLVFLTFWTLLVYCPFVHMIWSPQGMLAKWGVVDFAGGIVVHATAGFAALASALYVGKRTVASDGTHNIPYIALGAGLLWFGWYGFNAGSELQVNTVTVSAFVTT